MTGPLRVLIADAAPLQRAGLRAILTEPRTSHQATGLREIPTGETSHQASGPRQTPAGETRHQAGGPRWSPAGETGDRAIGRREIVVAGEAGDGVEAAALARRLLPDVLISDVDLPRANGLAVIGALAEARLAVPVILLTGRDTDDEAIAAMSAGAAGYFGKDTPHDELVTAVHAVAAGGAVVAPQILARVLNRLATALPALPDTNTPSPLAPLTAREREVLLHIARGRSNSEIAESLGVNETTVKTHVNHVLTKLRLRDRTQAVILAYETGLIRPGT